MPDQPAPALRILIGVESAADAPRALRLLPILARGMPALFGGLLIMNQVAAKSKPFSSRVVTTQGQIVAAPDADRMKEIVEAEARAFRQMMADAARSFGAEWTAEVKIGTLGSDLASVANAWDIVVVGHRALHRRRGSVVVFESGADDDDLHALASRMASELGTDVEVLRPRAREASEPTALAKRLDRLSTAAVVLDAANASFDSLQQVTELLSVARCPIVILGSAALQPKLEHSLMITPSPKAET